MAKELTTLKVPPASARNLRTIAGITGEKQYNVIERLIKAELEKVRKEFTKRK